MTSGLSCARHRCFERRTNLVQIGWRRLDDWPYVHAHVQQFDIVIDDDDDLDIARLTGHRLDGRFATGPQRSVVYAQMTTELTQRTPSRQPCRRPGR